MDEDYDGDDNSGFDDEEDDEEEEMSADEEAQASLINALRLLGADAHTVAELAARLQAGDAGLQEV